jgi:glycerophosphoryl diester phosphodiesterase
VIAHRGASRARRENTVEAFRHAADLGADAVELDVRCTGDRYLAVHHDAALDDGSVIVELEWAELQRRAPWVPGLAEALAACVGMWVNIEIKNSPTDPDFDPDGGTVDEVIDLLEDAGLIDRVLLSSFDPTTLSRVRARRPELATGWLVERGIPLVSFVPAAAQAGHQALHPAAESLAGAEAGDLVRSAHAAGLMVNVWTVDDPAAIAGLAALGVDGIVTNVPDVARSVLG